MIQVTINLENEQSLRNDLAGLINSLSEEQISKIAEKTLFKYLTDVVDYDKEIYITKSVEEARKKGIKSNWSYNSKSIEDLKDLSDDDIKNLTGFEEVYLSKYKSPRDSRIEEINKVIDNTLKSNIDTFVKENEDLKNILEEKQENIKNNFHQLVKDTMLGLISSLIFETIDKARFSYDNNSRLQSLVNTIMERQL